MAEQKSTARVLVGVGASVALAGLAGVPYESRHYLPLEPGRVFTFTASRGTGIRIRVYRSGLFWPVLVYEGEASGTTLSWGTQHPGTYYVYIYRREDSTWYPDSTAV
ncbi:MAG: hypothetical protein QXY39_04215, partial [Thermofilaceae archaeon]